MANSVFLSYRRADRADLVERLYDHLEQHFGRERVFIDIDGIPAGTDFVTHIEHMLGKCGVLLAALGPRWLEEIEARAHAVTDGTQLDFVRVEIERALARGTPVLPVLLGDARMPAAARLPESLAAVARLQAIHLRSGPDFRTDVARIISAVESLVGEPAKRPAAARPADAPHTLRIPLSSGDMERHPQKLEGLRIGPYVVRRVIGSGGSGVALAATHAALARDVCVKVSFPFGEETQTLMGAVRRGMRGLVQLDHRNVAKVFDFDELELDDGSSFFIALEYIDGVPLDEWARRLENSATPDDYAARAMSVIRQITEGLVAAHACRYADDAGFQITGVMHGDIKPSNIIVRSNDVPVLLDFMLVDVQRHLRGGAPPRPVEGIPSTAAFGTPGFMAPEQEEKGIVTPATDIYGFGMTLLCAFQDVVLADTRLKALVMKMIASEPSTRPGSMQAIADALGAIAAPPPAPVGPETGDDVTPLPAEPQKGFFRRLFG